VINLKDIKKTSSNKLTHGKKLLVPSILLTAFLILSIYGTTQVSASDLPIRTPLAQKIASKFGLNTADVEEVIEQEKINMWEKRKQNLSSKLSQAVTDGKMTEEQKNKILEKLDEMEAEREAERQTHKEELQEFLKAEGVDENVIARYLFGGMERKNFPKSNH
jgi:hypothetical protein